MGVGVGEECHSQLKAPGAARLLVGFTITLQADIIYGLGNRMWAYTGRRILGLIPVLLGISLTVFLFLHLIPGNPATVMLGERASPQRIAELSSKLGLDKPLPEQYIRFLGNLLQGDLGNSIFNLLPIREQLATRWPATFELAIAAMIVATVLGIPLGILAAVRKNSIWDNASTILSLVGVSMPVFWLGLLLIYLFAVNLQWLPPSGRIGVDAGNTFKTITGFFVLDSVIQRAHIGEVVSHLILPALTLGTIPLAILTRITRSAMLEVLSQDYVRTARAKGLAEVVTTRKHVLRNALIPVVTVVGANIANLVGGAVFLESIYSWPGMGQLYLDGVESRDYPLIMGLTLVLASVILMANLATDLLYGLIDPRIRYD